MPSDAAELLAREQIKELKARYCRFIDTKQWDRLTGLFTSETRFDGFGSAPSGSDAAAFVAGISRRFVGVVSIHHCHMPEIAFTGPGAARGIWSMMDYVEFPADAVAREAPGSRGFMGYGFYEEEYVLVGGGWRFRYLRLTRMRIDPLPADHPRSGTGLLPPTPGWL